MYEVVRNLQKKDFLIFQDFFFENFFQEIEPILKLTFTKIYYLLKKLFPQ